MIEANRMRLGKYEFAVKAGTFRRITGCWSGPGWDFKFSGECINDEPEEPVFGDGMTVYCEAAHLPFAKAADYSGVECDLPGTYDEESGEPNFAIDVGESYDLADAKLRFAARDGSRYLIELSGTASEQILGQSEPFELLAWAEEMPDHSYLS